MVDEDGTDLFEEINWQTALALALPLGGPVAVAGLPINGGALAEEALEGSGPPDAGEPQERPTSPREP